MAAIVEAKDVYKTYKGKVAVPALNGVDLRIERGEMVAIMGPSGCGKTTLLNCLSGLDRFDSGEVLIEGVSLAGCRIVGGPITGPGVWASCSSSTT